ncbi:SGNH/GDSL hydrolase family protein [Candidatus Binatia bacterium]|nr:SGNH/GDSL hydrolase family protein [Candidatus Binatia bacterium]
MPEQPRRPTRRIWTNVLLAILPTLVLLLVAEAVLRWTGAAERCPAFENSILWVCDPILGFKPNPGQAIDGQRLINGAGFRSREFGPKRAGVYRILALGDSGTFGVISPGSEGKLAYVDEPYPQRLDRLLAERQGAERAEVFNAAVPGYNSFHGALLLRSKLRDLQPDLIAVRFGWNDHAMSPAGESGAYRRMNAGVGRVAEDLLLRTALYPFSRRLGMELRRWLSADGEQGRALLPPAWKPDIPIGEYERNLQRIVELGRAEGAAVWLLTAPHAFVLGGRREAEDALPATSSAHRLLATNAIPSFDRLIEIHEAYAAATRTAGARLGVPVVDMAQLYADRGDPALFAPGDVLHPTDTGHALEAEALYERVLVELKGGDTTPAPRAGIPRGR